MQLVHTVVVIEYTVLDLMCLGQVGDNVTYAGLVDELSTPHVYGLLKPDTPSRDIKECQ